MAKTKTKAELMEELEQVKAELAELEKKYRNDLSATAEGIRDLFNALVEAGFTEEQAILILVSFLRKNQENTSRGE